MTLSVTVSVTKPLRNVYDDHAGSNNYRNHFHTDHGYATVFGPSSAQTMLPMSATT